MGDAFFKSIPDLVIILFFLKLLKFKKKNKTTTYISVADVKGIVQLVQMNAFEIHTWNCQNLDMNHPDQIIIDFDPGPNVTFMEVISAAKDLKKNLDKLKLKSFVKLSGGKGLHVHVPIAPIYSWDLVKHFTKALADKMVSDGPDKYTANMSKTQRKGKIFIDYLRNGIGPTTVAPYSLRARPYSAVAMPISWNQLEKIKSSDQFDLKSALSFLSKRKNDPWKGINKLKQKILILDKLENAPSRMA